MRIINFIFRIGLCIASFGHFTTSAFLFQSFHLTSVSIRNEISQIKLGFDSFHSENLSPRRRKRLAKERAIQQRFAFGEDLHNLRTDLDHLRENLQWAEAINDVQRICDLTKAIENGENRDPEKVYHKALKNIRELERSPLSKIPDKEIRKQQWNALAHDARLCIPRFQLSGLWVGK
jgi:hypothetical protein